MLFLSVLRCRLVLLFIAFVLLHSPGISFFTAQLWDLQFRMVGGPIPVTSVDASLLIESLRLSCASLKL